MNVNMCVFVGVFVCIYICVFVFLIVNIKACVYRDQKYVFFGARIADVSARN